MTEQAPGQPVAETADTQVEAQPQVPEGYVPQKDVSKIAAREKREGKTSRDTEILERAQGAESIDDILSVWEAHQLTQAEMETAADKAEKAREKAEAKAQAAEERYTTTLREFALRDALRDSGINPERLKGAMRLADLSALEVDGEGNVTGIEEVVASVQEESPEWFGQAERPRINAPQTAGTGVQTPTNGGMTPEEAHANWLLSMFDNSR